MLLAALGCHIAPLRMWTCFLCSSLRTDPRNINCKVYTFNKKFLMLQNEAITWLFQNPVSCVWVPVVSVAGSEAGAGSSIINGEPADTGHWSSSQHGASGLLSFLPQLLLLPGDNQLEGMTHLPRVFRSSGQFTVNCQLKQKGKGLCGWPLSVLGVLLL